MGPSSRAAPRASPGSTKGCPRRCPEARCGSRQSEVIRPQRDPSPRMRHRPVIGRAAGGAGGPSASNDGAPTRSVIGRTAGGTRERHGTVTPSGGSRRGVYDRSAAPWVQVGPIDQGELRRRQLAQAALTRMSGVLGLHAVQRSLDGRLDACVPLGAATAGIALQFMMAVAHLPMRNATRWSSSGRLGSESCLAWPTPPRLAITS